MAIKLQNIQFNQIVDDTFLRIDAKYHLFVEQSHWIVFPETDIEKQVPLAKILTPCFVTHNLEEGEMYRGIPTGRDYVDEDGYITNYLYITSENCPDRVKYAITSSNILISSIRQAVTPALNFEGLSNIENYVFSNGYYIFNVRKGYLKKYVLYLLRSKRIKKILDNSIYRGIGISSYKINDFMRIMVPEIDINTQKGVLDRIEPLEKELFKLKQRIRHDKDIINTIITKTFNLDIEELNRLDKIKFLSIKSYNLTEGGTELRDSVRFTKMRLLQQEMLRHYDDYLTLDECLLQPKTQNGWSPENNDIEGETKLLGIDALHFNGVLTTDNPKFTNETRDDIENYYVNDGDLFISRGNTVDLVALASIAENIEEDFLYPDIMIKLFVDETKIDKQFLVYLFNSIIGRLYFKYASKGKQQTMVKVSSNTIKNFVIPKIALKKQREIVKKIRKSTDAQNKIRKKIKDLRDEIDSIIEMSMSYNIL